MHTIRLHAAWRRLSATTSQRRFHTPTGLDPGDRVWIVLGASAGVEEVRFNGEPLTRSEEPRWEVTQLLRRDRGNEVTISVEGVDPESVTGSARLEIEPGDEAP